jgi:hypothetical protein
VSLFTIVRLGLLYPYVIGITYCYDKLMKCTLCTFEIKTVIKELEI